MKFGKQLELLSLPKYRGHYIQYKELKKALKVWTGVEKDQSTVQEVTHWASSFLRVGPNPEVSPEMRLNSTLREEMERINKFAELEEGGLRMQLGRLEEDVKKRQSKDDEEWATLTKQLDDLGEQIVQLKAFARLNFTGFRKILKKYDKWSSSRAAVTPWFMAEVVRAPFMRVGYSSLLAQFNRISKSMRKAGASERQLNRSSSGVFDTSAHPTSELVFLIDPSDTMRVRVLLARHLNAKGLMDTSPERTRTCGVYFDTKGLSVYGAHLGEGATPDGGAATAAATAAAAPCATVHLRHCGGDAAILVAEGPGEARKEVPLTVADATKLLKGSVPMVGRVPPDSLALLTAAAPSVSKEQALPVVRAAHEALQKSGQSAMAQATYVRSVFQDDSGIFTVILDEELRMARTSDPFASQPTASEYFPHNVLTVCWSSTVGRCEDPQWYRAISDMSNLVQVSGFSKAAHVLAHLYAKSCSERLPHWYRNVMNIVDEEQGSEEQGSQDVSDPMESAEAEPLPFPSPTARPRANTAGCARLLHEFGTTPEEEASALAGRVEEEPYGVPSDAAGGLDAPLLAKDTSPRAKGKKARFGGLLQRLSRLLGFSHEDEDAALKVRTAIVAVQPKTIFSNERTFLEWMHFATILASLGVALMHGVPTPESVPIGRFLVVTAVVLALRSLHTFHWRADALDGKEIIDYHDRLGPPAIIVALLVALGWSVAHAMHWVPVPASALRPLGR